MVGIIDFKSPKPIQVYVTIPASGANNKGKPWTARIGVCNTEAEIKKIIEDDVEAMGDTLGGLIEPTSTEGRRYQAFRAVWTEIDLSKL